MDGVAKALKKKDGKVVLVNIDAQPCPCYRYFSEKQIFILRQKSDPPVLQLKKEERMAINKRINDLTDHASVLPYASELFGVYQPLLGWRSQRSEERFQKGFSKDKLQLLERLKTEFLGLVDVQYGDNNQVNIEIKPGVLETGKFHSFDSVVLEQLSLKLPPEEITRVSTWRKVITSTNIDTILKEDVTKTYTEAYSELSKPQTRVAAASGIAPADSISEATAPSHARIKVAAFEGQLQYESSIAGALLFLVKSRKYKMLNEIFYNTKDNKDKAGKLIRMFSAKNSVEAFLNINNLDPQDRDQISDVSLSPISVVHLFRQYFFELDTFLGTPVNHVWLSPGSSVELYEIHTRKTTVERTLETSLDLLTKSEQTTTTQDEISDAIKENNANDIKLGASVTASYASIEASSSFDYNNSQQRARENTHKKMRQQTEKLSSEIRKNVKTTFKTTTEFTDIASTRHLLANDTDKLINYEMRRKMRQVGVQVQDIGTYLCWQTYVDDPGKELGLGKLIHIAKPAELDGIPHPETIPMLQPFQEQKMITIPFIPVDGGADKEGEVYEHGIEVDDSEWFGELEKIKADFMQEFVCPKSNYTLINVEFDPGGKPLVVSRSSITNSNGKASFNLHLDSVDFEGRSSILLKVVLHWSPTDAANKAISEQNEARLEELKEREKAEYEKAYVETVKERVTATSKIISRKSDELREEERIVIYRKLVQDMLLRGVPLPDDHTRHVAAELINSIFDIDKMLYFVAPEWWRPRLHRSKQQLQPTSNIEPVTLPVTRSLSVLHKGLHKKMDLISSSVNSNVLSPNTAGWGGINDNERDNYYITEDSEPTKIGSSLGWLLQLDGDNMRNAFLNAPWVKSVIPIRPGKEEAAINWLKGVEGMNGITDDVIYHTSNPDEKDMDGNPLDGQKMIDVLMDLARKIKKKHEDGIKTGQYPKEGEVSDPQLVDPENVVTSTPIDRVYEHGFYPLKGSFRVNVDDNYEIFDQWIEVLPTDQVVPVEVAYDPKTGRQL